MSHKSVVIGSSIALGVVCIIGLIIWGSFALHAYSEVVIDPDAYYLVESVVDGDTFKVDVGASNVGSSDSQVITVRVLGINTPETVDPRRPVQCYGPEASKEAKSLLGGHKVKLTFSPNREMKDKYGRYLAYVYRDDGLFFNEYMIDEGYAREYTVGTAYSLQVEFRTSQKEAQKAKKGLWGACK